MKSCCVLQNASCGIWVIFNPFDRTRPPLTSVFLKQLLPMLEMVVFVSGFVRRRLLKSSHAKFRQRRFAHSSPGQYQPNKRTQQKRIH